MINKKIGVGENKAKKEKKKKRKEIKSKDPVTEDDEDKWEDEGEVEDMEVEVDHSTAVGETVEAGNGEIIEDSTMNVEKQTEYIDEAVLEADKIF